MSETDSAVTPGSSSTLPTVTGNPSAAATRIQARWRAARVRKEMAVQAHLDMVKDPERSRFASPFVPSASTFVSTLLDNLQVQ